MKKNFIRNITIFRGVVRLEAKSMYKKLNKNICCLILRKKLKVVRKIELAIKKK